MIKTNKYLLIFFVALCLHEQVNAKVAKPKEFIVVTFELVKNKIHRTKRYYWIIPTDSIENNRIPMFSLYLQAYFDSSELQDCCKGNVIDVLESTESDTVTLSNDYQKALEELNNLVFKYRKKVQKVQYRWYNPDHEEVIQIYITPITGNFCFCMQKFSSFIKDMFQEGNIFLPLSDFSYNNGFWESEKLKAVETFDYSTIKYVNTH